MSSLRNAVTDPSATLRSDMLAPRTLILLALGAEAFAATTNVLCATQLGSVSLTPNKTPKPQLYIVR